jgi:uncharacterized protein (TIGR04141 family)
VRPLTVYLLKTGVTGPQEAIDGSAEVDGVPVEVGSSEAMLFVKSSKMRRPPWLGFFDGYMDLSVLGLWTASSSAVLVVCVAERWFAVTFGHGRHLLKQGAWESNFGLRVTLNSIEDSSIRSVDRRSFDSVVRQTREQASRPGRIEEFGLHVEEDLLRAVVGRPNDETLGRRLTGMDALGATVALELPDLPGQLERYLQKFRETGYRERYPWVDHVAEIRDRGLVEDLDQQLSGRLRCQNLDHAWLAVPEPIDWGEVGGFRFSSSKRAPIHSDIHLQSLLDELGSPETVSAATLKRRHVFCLGPDGPHARHKWSAYRCLYAEVRKEGKLFLLSGGQWFEVDQTFVERVDADVETLPETRHSLPPYGHDDEAHYNRSVAQESDAAALMDRKNIRYGGGASAIEFCDLFFDQRALVHVKRYGGSSALSHLFSQGLVSATLFAQDSEFRARVRDKLEPGHRSGVPEEHPRLQEYEVGFAIISRSGGELVLPFFSKVNLRNVSRTLRGLGYRVTLTKIGMQDTPE